MIKSFTEKLDLFLEINKIRITIAVSITTITGYVLYRQQFDTGLLLPTLGIFLLACGSSVINHIQERRYDKKMRRTKNRPLPSGKISLSFAWVIAITEIMAGSTILFFSGGPVSMVLGLSALLWYNLVYTNLKRISARAVIPGSLIGSIPPVVGWISAGGSLSDPRAWIMALFFFVWQVPHFMLLSLKFSGDYRAAGFPNLRDVLTDRQIRKNIFFWILLTGTLSMLIPLFHLSRSLFTGAGILTASLMLILLFYKLLRDSGEFEPVTYFRYINYYVLLVVLLLCTDHLFVSH